MRCLLAGLVWSVVAAKAIAAQTPPPGVALGASGSSLVSLDFAATAVGEFPTNLTMIDGVMDVVMVNGRHLLRASAPSAFLIRLPQVLPTDFTVEVDLVPKVSGNENDFGLEGTPSINQGSASAYLLWHSEYLRVIGGDVNNFEARVPDAVAVSTPGVLTRVTVVVQGTTMRVYTNGRLLSSLSNRRFVRGPVLRVFLGGQDDATQAVYLAAVRVTSSAVPGSVIAAGGNAQPSTAPGGAPNAPTSSSAAPGAASSTTTGATGSSSGSPPPATTASSTTSPGSTSTSGTSPTGASTSTSGTSPTSTTATPPATAPGTPGPAAGTSRTGTTATKTYPGPASLTTKVLMEDGSGWGVLLTWSAVANATGYRVSRAPQQLDVMTGQTTSGPSTVAHVTDVTTYVGSRGTVAVVDPYVLPNNLFTYTVEALFAGNVTSAPTTSPVVIIGNFRIDPSTLPNASPIQALVSGTKSVALPGQLGASGPQSGSEVTWTWNVPGLVLLYETSYEIVGGVPGIGAVYERVTLPTTGLPPNPPSLTLGVPSGMTVKFCVSFYAFTSPNNILPPEAACLTTTVPGASSIAPPTSHTGVTTTKSASPGTSQPGSSTSTQPAGSSSTSGTPTSTAPTGVSTQDLYSSSGWGVVIGWSPVANATSYRVNRTVSGSGAPASVVKVIDLTALLPTTGMMVVDPYVLPSTSYTYWVEAVFPDGSTGTPSTISSVTTGTGGFGMQMAGAMQLQVAVSGTKTTTMPGAMASSGLTQGSDVTWTWGYGKPVFVWQVSYELVNPGGGGLMLVERSEVPNTPLPVPAPVVFTRGVPQGMSVRLCIHIWADSDRTKPLPADAACVVTSVP